MGEAPAKCAKGEEPVSNEYRIKDVGMDWGPWTALPDDVKVDTPGFIDRTADILPPLGAYDLLQRVADIVGCIETDGNMSPAEAISEAVSAVDNIRVQGDPKFTNADVAMWVSKQSWNQYIRVKVR